LGGLPEVGRESMEEEREMMRNELRCTQLRKWEKSKRKNERGSNARIGLN
jgi:hypothetical protein